jgi:hypothetical protein
MKSTVETKVAAVIAASFVALTFGVVAQENNEGETRRLRQVNSAMASELSNVIPSDLDASVSGRKNAEEANIKLPDDASQRGSTEIAQSDH